MKLKTAQGFDIVFMFTDYRRPSVAQSREVSNEVIDALILHTGRPLIWYDITRNLIADGFRFDHSSAEWVRVTRDQNLTIIERGRICFRDNNSEAWLRHPDNSTSHHLKAPQFNGMSVEEGADAIMKKLTFDDIAYAGDPARGRYRGFAALHDLCDANMIIPFCEQMGEEGQQERDDRQIDWSNLVTDRVSELIIAKYQDEFLNGPREEAS